MQGLPESVQRAADNQADDDQHRRKLDKCEALGFVIRASELCIDYGCNSFFVCSDQLPQPVLPRFRITLRILGDVAVQLLKDNLVAFPTT